MGKSRTGFIFLLCLSGVAEISAQQKTAEELIAASQTDGAASFFEAGISDRKPVDPGSYDNPSETNIRRGLPHFFTKAKSRKPVKIAYIGGSITRATDQYRMQSFEAIQRLLPHTPMVGINAGVSGSDTELGACRIDEHVLQHGPDLIFIEFAVNGGYPQGMEGMVRQIIRHNDKIDICFIYTLTAEQFNYYQQNTLSPVIQKLEAIAAYYTIPSIHLGMEAADLAQQGALLPKGNPVSDRIPVFSQDGVHPLETGGNLYAAAILRSMLRMKDTGKVQAHGLPDPLYSDNWEDAKMIAPEQIRFSNDWKKLDPSGTSLQGYKSWFPEVMTSEKSGETFTFRYKGTAFGLFDIGAPETGQLDVFVDGVQVSLRAVKGDKLFVIDESVPRPLTRFNRFCNNRTRGQYALVQTPGGGEHTVTFRISETMPDKKRLLGVNQQADITSNFQKYNHNQIYLGKILLCGELLPLSD